MKDLTNVIECENEGKFYNSQNHSKRISGTVSLLLGSKCDRKIEHQYSLSTIKLTMAEQLSMKQFVIKVYISMRGA